MYEVPKLQPGFKIRSPQQVVAPRFHRELMQFLKLWEFIPPGKNRDYMGGQIKKCWDKHKAFRGILSLLLLLLNLLLLLFIHIFVYHYCHYTVIVIITVII